MTSTFVLDRHVDPSTAHHELARDVRAWLTTSADLPPKWLYDATGSDLFEQITKLPEYYPFEREREVLRAAAPDLAGLTAAGTLVELGSGSSEKTEVLLGALTAAGSLTTYVPVDISEDALTSAAERVAAQFPGVAVHAVLADFARVAAVLPRTGRRLVVFLGGTIGNLDASARARFLGELAAGLAPGESLLLGTDLVKDRTRLVRAYDDSAGVSAAFNLNLLHVVNRELGADFDVDAFEHVARFDEEHQRIEMSVRSRTAQTVHVRALDLTVPFTAGQTLRTEISCKFTRERLEAEYAAAGLTLTRWWTDPAGDYALSLATRPADAVVDVRP